MRFIFGTEHHRVASTDRIEFFSDGVIAIIITILAIELHVPSLTDTSLYGVFAGMNAVLPSIISFALSFLTLAVFWVNHHHFFHELHHADAHLMWFNNLLLFWLSLIPFTTAFISAYPLVPGVLFIYSLVLLLAALSFALLTRHALFVENLLDEHITDRQKAAYYRRNCIGVLLYVVATVLAPFLYFLSLAIIIVVPILYIMPRLMHDHEAMENSL